SEDLDLTQTATNLTSYWSQGSPPSQSDLDDVNNTMSRYEQKLSDYFNNAGSAAHANPANPQNPLQIDLTQPPSALVISITSDCLLGKIRQGVQPSQWGSPAQFIIVPLGVAAIWGTGRGRKTREKNKDGTTPYFYRNGGLGLPDVPMVEFSGS